LVFVGDSSRVLCGVYSDDIHWHLDLLQFSVLVSRVAHLGRQHSTDASPAFTSTASVRRLFIRRRFSSGPKSSRRVAAKSLANPTAWGAALGLRTEKTLAGA